MAVFICTGNKGKLEEFKQALHANEQVFGIADLNNGTTPKFIEAKENSDYFVCNAAVKLFSAVKFIAENYTCNEYLGKIKKIIVDDSGLCVPNLNYLPGVHSAYFSGTPKNDIKNNLLLRKKIEESPYAKIYKDEKRLEAFFVCFLLSISISDAKDFEFTKFIDFSEASFLLKPNGIENNHIISLEKKLLEKVDLNLVGGAFSEKIQASLFCSKFPKNIFININYGFSCGEISTKEQNNIPGMGHGYDPIFYSKQNPELSFASIPLNEKNKISHRAFAMGGLKKTEIGFLN